MLVIINDSGVFGNVARRDMQVCSIWSNKQPWMREDSCIAQLGDVSVRPTYSAQALAVSGKFLLNVKIVAVDEAKY